MTVAAVVLNGWGFLLVVGLSAAAGAACVWLQTNGDAERAEIRRRARLNVGGRVCGPPRSHCRRIPAVFDQEAERG